MQVTALQQLQDHVRPVIDDLDRVGADDIGMLAELGPDPALRGESADSGAAPHQFATQGLQRDYLAAGLAEVIVHDEDQAHATFVNIEYLEPIADPPSYG